MVLSSREYQGEQLKPIWHTGPGGMSQSFSLEYCQGMLPGKLCSRVRILSASVRKCTHYVRTRLSREYVRKPRHWWQEDAQLLGYVSPSAVHHCWRWDSQPMGRFGEL